MTSFTDFFVAQSPTKVAKVRAAKRMMEGDGFDHWMSMRTAVIEALVGGGIAAPVTACVANATARQTATYVERAQQMKAWMKNKNIQAHQLGPGKLWNSPMLTISVNPEVQITVGNATPANLKLYFKADPLSKRAADPMLRLIEQMHGTKENAAILDVQRRRLFTGPTTKPADLDLLLTAEATSFGTIWAGL